MYLYLKCFLKFGLFAEPPSFQRQQSKPGEQWFACLTSHVVLI